MTDTEILEIVGHKIDGKEIEQCQLDGANRWIPFDGFWYFSCQAYRIKPEPQDEDEAAFEKWLHGDKSCGSSNPLDHVKAAWQAGLAHARQQKGGDALCSTITSPGSSGAAQSDPESAPEQQEDAMDKEMRESGFHPSTPEEIQRYSKHHNPEFERKPEEIWVHDYGDTAKVTPYLKAGVMHGSNCHGCRLFREVI